VVKTENGETAGGCALSLFGLYDELHRKRQQNPGNQALPPQRVGSQRCCSPRDHATSSIMTNGGGGVPIHVTAPGKRKKRGPPLDSRAGWLTCIAFDIDYSQISLLVIRRDVYR